MNFDYNIVDYLSYKIKLINIIIYYSRGVFGDLRIAEHSTSRLYYTYYTKTLPIKNVVR